MYHEHAAPGTKMQLQDFAVGGNLDLWVYNNFILFSEKFLIVFRKIYFFYCISVFIVFEILMKAVEASTLEKRKGGQNPPNIF